MAVQNKELGSVDLTLKSLRLWEGLAEELDCDVGFEMRGGYRLACSEADVEKLQRDVAGQQGLGVPVEIVPQAVLRRELPFLSDRVIAAGYDFLVRSSAGNVQTPIVVNAANVWAGKIAKMVGCHLPVTMDIQTAMITNGGPKLFPYVLTAVKGNLTLKQEFPSGRVIIGGGWSGTGDYVTEVKRVDFANMVGNLRTAAEAVPALGMREVVRAWACYEGRSPDRLLMIGPIPSPRGFYVQCCVKGGFTLAPIVGLSMAEWLINGRPATSMDQYLVTRFVTTSAKG
jgi:glycine/D-amino acid oxidase-like deaminating enzyme